MNFAEIRFWEIFLTALTLVLAVRMAFRGGERFLGIYDRAALLCLGLVLLLAVSWKTFLIFLAVSWVTYLGVFSILRWMPSHRRLGLWILIPIQLAPLLYYKYANFFVNEALPWHVDALRGMAIPVGISFYTFQKIAFACDTLAFEKSLPGPLDFMNFAGFFPQIVAGPIERRDELLPQIQAFRFRWSAENLDQGLSWVVIGLFFKRCLADNFAELFKAAAVGNAWEIWLSNFIFGVRIYYDFAGYSLMALGLARCLGVRLTLNFRSPYCSRSATEFWRRWHVTLSQWMRDYIYIPLGGNRVRYWVFNLFAVFFISGIWHGAGWNFMAWGLLHGVYLLIHRLSGEKMGWPPGLAWAVTMLAVFFAWLCFYETDTRRLGHEITSVFTPAAYSFAHGRAALGRWGLGERASAAGLALLAGGTFFLEWRSLARRQPPYAEFERLPVLIALVVLTLFLAPGQNSAFLYFAF